MIDFGVFSDHENAHKTYVAGEVILEGWTLVAGEKLVC
jgi:hypothetical protein